MQQHATDRGITSLVLGLLSLQSLAASLFGDYLLTETVPESKHYVIPGWTTSLPGILLFAGIILAIAALATGALTLKKTTELSLASDISGSHTATLSASRDEATAGIIFGLLGVLGFAAIGLQYLIP